MKGKGGRCQTVSFVCFLFVYICVYYMEMSILRIELEGGMQEEILDYLEKDYKSLVNQIRKNRHIKILQRTRGILKETSVGKVSGPMLKYQDGRSTETLMIQLFGREKEVPMEGYAQVRGKTGPGVRIKADLAPSGMARTLALLSGGRTLSKLYALQTYSVRVHESSDVSSYKVGQKREEYIVLKKEGSNVYLGYDERWYFSSVMPTKRWFPFAQKRFKTVPFWIYKVYNADVIYAQGVAKGFRGDRRGLTFFPYVKKYNAVASPAWEWHKYYNGRGPKYPGKVFQVKLSDLSSEALSILYGKVEGDMNKVWLRGLSKYNLSDDGDSRKANAELVEIQMDLTRDNEIEFAQNAKQKPDGSWRPANATPVKAKGRGYYSSVLSPSQRSQPRSGKGSARYMSNAFQGTNLEGQFNEAAQQDAGARYVARLRNARRARAQAEGLQKGGVNARATRRAKIGGKLDRRLRL